MELEGHIKNYEWGKLGETSEVARLVKCNNSNTNIVDNIPYAELWMGDHVNGSSIVKATGQKLEEVHKLKLPYLFKILSIRKGLSIQVHPNKQEAEILHREKPDLYTDANHKPELVIALTPFKALCGFRPYSEIHRFCKDLPPLKELLGGDAAIDGLCTDSMDHLKTCYQTLMTASPEKISSVINEILKEYEHVLKKYGLREIFLTINSDYPDDVGVLSLFFLNLLEVKPGESIYMYPNEIHAYLSGDCIECSAGSDNVIRAGLTPKYKDVKQLLAMLNYTGAPAFMKRFTPKQLDANTKLFAPPVPDFAVIEISSSSETSQILKLSRSPGMLIVLKGSRTLRLIGHSDLALNRGSIIFIPAECMNSIEFLNLSRSTATFTAYLATQNLFACTRQK